MNPNIRGVHYKGPVLGSSDSGGGFYRDMPVAAFEQSRSPYKIFYEDFATQFIDGATAQDNLILAGCTMTDTNTATSPSAVVGGANNYLLLDAGSKADSGSEYQFILPPNALTTESPDLNILGPITSTTTLMDKKEIFWEARVGIASSTTDWDGHFLMGWFTTDTTLITNTTGVLAVADGGGFGFYADGDTGNGDLQYVAGGGALTSGTVITGYNFNTDITVADTLVWYKLGARMLVNDASAFTGVNEFYVNDVKVADVVDVTCMDSTEVYSFSIVCHNGPTDDIQVAVDYIMTGITRDGLTYPYSDGTPY